MGTFSATVNAWVAKSQARMEAVHKGSVQSMIEIMQEPGPSRASTSRAVSSGRGLGKTKKDGSRGVSKRAFGPVSNPGGTGRLPLDTGFLRASLVVSIGDTLPPLKDSPKGDAAQAWDIGSVKLTIAGADITNTITAAYSAAYARRIEYGFSGKDSLGRTYSQGGARFVALAAQQWQAVVAAESAKAQAIAGG